jgi:hypothetical protein
MGYVGQFTGPGAIAQRTMLARLGYVHPELVACEMAVLGWTFEPGRVEVGGTQPVAGLAGGAQPNSTVPMWTVADVEAAVVRVRESGGTVISGPARQP